MGPDYSRNIWSDLLLPSPHRQRLGLNLGFRPISFPQSVYPQTFVCVPVPERRSLKDMESILKIIHFDFKTKLNRLSEKKDNTQIYFNN